MTESYNYQDMVLKIAAWCGKTPLVCATPAISSITALEGLMGGGVCPSLASLPPLVESSRTCWKEGKEKQWCQKWKKWRLPLVWRMDCQAGNEVSAAHCTPGYYNAYVHDLCTPANSKPEAVMNETLANSAACLQGIKSCSLNHLRAPA